jgi:hypothetical protein
MAAGGGGPNVTISLIHQHASTTSRYLDDITIPRQHGCGSHITVRLTHKDTFHTLTYLSIAKKNHSATPTPPLRSTFANKKHRPTLNLSDRRPSTISGIRHTMNPCDLRMEKALRPLRARPSLLRCLRANAVSSFRISRPSTASFSYGHFIPRRK